MRKLLVLTLVLPALSAFAAAPNNKAKESAALAREADRFYKDGRYKEAAEALQKAYDIDPNPTLLYNRARALDQAGEMKESLSAYREFVGLEGADAQLVKKANLAMDRLRGLVAKLDAEEAAREAEKKKADEAAAAEKEKAAAELAASQKARAELEAKQEKELSGAVKTYNLRKSLAFVAGGVAVASLASGIIFGVVSSGNKAEFTKATTTTAKDQYLNATKTTALVADISYGAAIVFAVATVIIFPKYTDPATLEKKVDVAIAPVPGGFQASLGVKF
jgi:tetratricopeptide (TPR) repeat protein